MKPARVLVVEDDPSLSEVVSDELTGRGHATRAAVSVRAAIEALDETDFDVVLLDLALPDGDGLEVLRHVADQGLAAEVIVVTGHGSIGSAVEAIRLGAYDYVSKPARLEEIEVLVGRAAEKSWLRRENASLRTQVERGHPAPATFVADDPAMAEVRRLLESAAAADVPVVVLGPRGAGRERLARTIHASGPRSEGPFVAFDAGVGEPGAAARELFGAHAPGLLQVADGGTLFVDDVERVDPGVLARLVRALEVREFVPEGGRRLLRADVRLIVASTLDLAVEARYGRFAPDAWQRLAGLVLRLPALRERPGDIPALAAQFLAAMPRPARLSAPALAALAGYAWPGNVRELRMVVQRAALLAGGAPEIDEAAVSAALGPAAVPREGLDARALERSFAETVNRPEPDSEDPERSGS